MLVAARRAGLEASAQVASLSQQYDLRMSAPPLPTPADQQLAVHLAMLLGDVTPSGEPREIVELYLQAARQERLALTGYGRSPARRAIPRRISRLTTTSGSVASPASAGVDRVEPRQPSRGGSGTPHWIRRLPEANLVRRPCAADTTGMAFGDFGLPIIGLLFVVCGLIVGAIVVAVRRWLG